MCIKRDARLAKEKPYMFGLPNEAAKWSLKEIERVLIELPIEEV